MYKNPCISEIKHFRTNNINFDVPYHPSKFIATFIEHPVDVYGLSNLIFQLEFRYYQYGFKNNKIVDENVNKYSHFVANDKYIF